MERRKTKREMLQAQPLKTKRSSLSDKVQVELHRRILDGRLEPGARIVELRIADEFGISQGTVRDALGRLEAQNLIVSEVYGKTRVRNASSRAIRDALEMRAEFERMAVSMAALTLKRTAVKLGRIASRIGQAADDGNDQNCHEQVYRFHQFIVTRASNSVLIRCWESTRFEFNVACRRSEVMSDLQRLKDAHWNIVEACEAGDVGMVQRLLEGEAKAPLGAPNNPDTDFKFKRSTDEFPAQLSKAS